MSKGSIIQQHIRMFTTNISTIIKRTAFRAEGSRLRASLKPLECHGNNLTRGSRGTLNRCPTMPTAVRCQYFPAWSYIERYRNPWNMTQYGTEGFKEDFNTVIFTTIKCTTARQPVASRHHIRLTHFCPTLRSTFAVRETASLGIMGAPRVPLLNPSETIVL